MNERNATKFYEAITGTPSIVRWVLSGEMHQPKGLDGIYPLLQAISLILIIIAIIILLIDKHSKNN